MKTNQPKLKQETNSCQNCGEILFGEFCSHCGQRDKDIHIPVAELASEFIDILPPFDRKLLRTVKLFILHPGILTNEYLAGKRKSFLSPFKFYFFISFLFFFVGSLNVTGQKKELRDELMQNNSLHDPSQRDTTLITIRKPDSGIMFSITSMDPLRKVFGDAFIDGFKSGSKNPQEFFQRIREHLPKILFLLLPVFALLLKAINFRSHHLYIRHLIFSFHFHSFIFFILLIDVLYEIVTPDKYHLAGNLILLSVPVYLFLGLRTVYGQSRWKTLAKFVILSVSHGVVFIFTVSIFVVLTVFIYFK